MKRSLLFIIAVFSFLPLFAQYKVTGGSVVPPFLAKTNGTTSVYLLNEMKGAQIQYTSSQPGNHKWYQYKKSIDDEVPVPLSQITQNGNMSVITITEDSCGYYVKEPMSTGYVWIVNYSDSNSNKYKYVVRFDSLKVDKDDEYKCERLLLKVYGNIPPINYYANGSLNVLPREFNLTYNTLEWQEKDKKFMPKKESPKYPELYSEIEVEVEVEEPPLVNTVFTLTDAYNVYFGIGQQAIYSEEYQAVKVKAYTSYEKDREFGDNEIHKGDSLSAPVSYTFTAYANEPVAAYYAWTILKKDNDTGQYSEYAQFRESVFRYPFEKEGDYLVQLKVDGAQSACSDQPEAIRIIIGSSDVRIPNAFSPGSSPGVNDELKVSFKSITSFRASVYNRWGNLLYQWTDPTKGWNGMVSGKFVPTGVYYVVVEYTDSNGKKKVEKRDVSILRSRN